MYTCRNYYDAATYRTEFYWRQLRERGVQTEEFFVENNFQKIAIYGLNYLGNELFKELETSKVEVIGIVDKYKNGEIFGKKIYKIQDVMELESSIDILVIAPVLSYNMIVDDLLLNGWSIDKILHIDDIIFNLAWRYL